MCRLDVFHPCHLYLTDVIWEVSYPLHDGLALQCLEEFKAKVIETTFVVSHRSNQNAPLVEELNKAHERGALTDEELRDELDWMNAEDFETQPF